MEMIRGGTMASQNIQSLPDEVAQMAATNQLGSFSQSYHVPSGQSVLDSLTIVTLCVFIVLLFCVVIFHVVGGLVFWLMVATGTATIITIIRAVNARENVVYLFQNGIIYSRKQQYTSLLWSQIASCQRHSIWRNGRLDQGIIRTTTGQRFPFGNLAGYEELATSIENAVKSHE
jgi:hypothetical protein